MNIIRKLPANTRDSLAPAELAPILEVSKVTSGTMPKAATAKPPLAEDE